MGADVPVGGRSVVSVSRDQRPDSPLFARVTACSGQILPFLASPGVHSRLGAEAANSTIVFCSDSGETAKHEHWATLEISRVNATDRRIYL